MSLIPFDGVRVPTVTRESLRANAVRGHDVGLDATPWEEMHSVEAKDEDEGAEAEMMEAVEVAADALNALLGVWRRTRVGRPGMHGGE
jgi:hypothetical protein